jgi:hypothetical protein
MLINPGAYESMIAEALHTGILFYLSGLLSLLAGLAIVNLHNTWCADWRVIVTILGWLMTIGGIIRIVVPQVAIAIGSTVYSGRAPTIVAALIIGALGAFLSFRTGVSAFGGTADITLTLDANKWRRPESK